MKLQFVKFDPTGNMTILVESPVPRSDQPRLAKQLTAAASVCAEQAGFLEAPTLPGARVRLQMAGGEFCGNASMSLAAFLALVDELPVGKEMNYPLEISGTEGLVPCRICRMDEVSFEGSVGMPLPEIVDRTTLPFGLIVPLIRFPGIVHLIVREDELTPAEAEALIPGLCETLKCDALGILLTKADFSAMRPLVYVRETGSAVWESGCGSGSAALAVCAAELTGEDASLQIAQPGGTIYACAEWSGDAIRSLQIRGRVRLVARGTAFVN